MYRYSYTNQNTITSNDGLHPLMNLFLFLLSRFIGQTSDQKELQFHQIEFIIVFKLIDRNFIRHRTIGWPFNVDPNLGLTAKIC